MSVILGRIQSDGYSYSDTLWSPGGAWSYEEAVENDDDTISARSYFEDGTMTENGTQLPNYSIKATPNRIGDTRLDDTPIEKSLTALRIYAERVEHQSFLDFLVANHIAFVDPRVVIDTSGAVDVTTLGMVGDGVTDNAVAFQAIIDSEAKIYIPSGVFVINAGTQLNNINVLIYGEGELKYLDADPANPDPDPKSILSAAGTVLSGSLTIDGISFNSQAIAGSSGISLHAAKDNFNTTVQNCTFQNHLGVAQNAISGFAYADDEKILNSRYINNTFINIGRIGIEINDRNYSPAVPNSTIVGLQILYNRFLFDTDAGQVVAEGNNHMFISLTGGDAPDYYQMMDTTIVGNYIENVNTGMETGELTDLVVSYNTLKNVNVPMMGKTTNKYTAYNYIECNVDEFFEQNNSDNNVYEYNQIVGYLKIGEHTGSIWRHNKIYAKWYHEPVKIETTQNTLFYDNYLEVYGTTDASSVIQARGIEVDSTVEVYDNKTFMVSPAEYSNLTYNGNGATATFTNNVETFTREALFPRVMPKMFK